MGNPDCFVVAEVLQKVQLVAYEILTAVIREVARDVRFAISAGVGSDAMVAEKGEGFELRQPG